MMVCARLTAVVAVDQVIAIAFRLGDFQLRADARIVVGRAGNVDQIVGGAGWRHGWLRSIGVPHSTRRPSDDATDVFILGCSRDADILVGYSAAQKVYY